MKFEVGDEVIVLLTKEEGKIIERINEETVVVEVRGVKFPAHVKQLDFPYFHRFSKPKQVTKKPEKKYIDDLPKEKQKAQTGIREEGISLSVVPVFIFDEYDDEIVDSLKLFLVNKTNAAIHFSYQQYVNGRSVFELTNELPAFKDFYLHDIPFAEINDSPAFHFLFSLISPQKDKAEEANVVLKPRAKQFFRQLEIMKEKNDPLVSFLLLEKYPDKKSSTDLPDFIIPAHSKRKPALSVPARSIVDLHIEKLVSDWKSMSNFEILQLQLDEFEKWFRLAVEQHLVSFIIIHGIGSGKLRDEIHSLLNIKKEVRYFINQYDPRFGYGATEIFLK